MKYRIKEIITHYTGRNEYKYKLQYKFLWWWFDYTFTQYSDSQYRGYHSFGSCTVTFTSLNRCKEVKDFLESNKDKDIDVGYEFNHIVYVDLGSKYNSVKNYTAYKYFADNPNKIKELIEYRRNKEYDNTIIKKEEKYIY